LPEFDVSADGRWIVFASTSTNLVEEDRNGVTDIFLHDTVEQKTDLVSVSATGQPADGPSSDPTISADGSWLGFRTEATTLYAGDTNGLAEGVLAERESGFVLPVASGPGAEPLDGETASPQFSADGGAVAFTAAASNLVPGDNNGKTDVFLVEFSKVLPKPVFLPLSMIRGQPGECLSAEDGPNDTVSQALANPALCLHVAVPGALPGNDPDDYYQIVLSDAAYVTVDLFNISPGSDFDLYLYDSDRNPLAFSANNGNANESISGILLTRGTYLVRVFPDPTEPGGARTYQVRWRR
jgi:hypothetical protein